MPSAAKVGPVLVVAPYLSEPPFFSPAHASGCGQKQLGRYRGRAGPLLGRSCRAGCSAAAAAVAWLPDIGREPSPNGRFLISLAAGNNTLQLRPIPWLRSHRISKADMALEPGLEPPSQEQNGTRTRATCLYPTTAAMARFRPKTMKIGYA